VWEGGGRDTSVTTAPYPILIPFIGVDVSPLGKLRSVCSLIRWEEKRRRIGAVPGTMPSRYHTFGPIRVSINPGMVRGQIRQIVRPTSEITASCRDLDLDV